MSFKGTEFEDLIEMSEFGIGVTKAIADERLDEAPQITVASNWFWRAYRELENDRQNGEEIGSIPFGSIVTFANEFGLVDRERTALFTVIRSLDLRWRVLMSAKRRDAQPKPK